MTMETEETPGFDSLERLRACKGGLDEGAIILISNPPKGCQEFTANASVSLDVETLTQGREDLRCVPLFWEAIEDEEAEGEDCGASDDGIDVAKVGE